MLKNIKAAQDKNFLGGPASWRKKIGIIPKMVGKMLLPYF
jgi:hypothetical protein